MEQIKLFQLNLKDNLDLFLITKLTCLDSKLFDYNSEESIQKVNYQFIGKLLPLTKILGQHFSTKADFASFGMSYIMYNKQEPSNIRLNPEPQFPWQISCKVTLVVEKQRDLQLLHIQVSNKANFISKSIAFEDHISLQKVNTFL